MPSGKLSLVWIWRGHGLEIKVGSNFNVDAILRLMKKEGGWEEGDIATHKILCCYKKKGILFMEGVSTG
mgnify:CR=1 FL=1